MKMKTRVATIIVMAVLLLSGLFWAHAQSKNSAVNATFTSNSNRFALLAGSYRIDHNRGESVDGIFKIDTFTGKTWALKVIEQNDVVMKKWIPVND